tara:strand:+ start:1317 stop:1658 length:342 start_codon:yes stop_codon:yes gene_type:complete
MAHFQTYQMPSHSGTGCSNLYSFLPEENAFLSLSGIVSKSHLSITLFNIMREIIIPYLHAFLAVKAAKQWEFFLKSDNGLDVLKNFIKVLKTKSSTNISYSGHAINASPVDQS